VAVTIKDVAKRAGVSASTVSRTLSGRIPVHEETKQKVMQAVRELNYQPNVLAKGLKEGRTHTIGLILPNIRNPVFPAVARGVEDIARKNGYIVILCNTDESLQMEKEYVDKLKKRWVDGLIFATAVRDTEHIIKLQESGFPVVLLVRNVGQQVDAVIVDNYKAAREAVEYLITMGHRKIAMINGNMDLTLYRERFAGYRKALEDAGIPFVRELVVEDESKDSDGYAAMNSLLKHEIVPDAVFASSDPKAAGVIRAIKDWGWKVPEDISVIGFDDLDMSALLDPPLTTISQPLYQMGARAAQRLIELIEGTKSDKPVIDIMETQLMIRGTVSFRFS
jgi:LacI family transcriptional regulator